MVGVSKGDITSKKVAHVEKDSVRSARLCQLGVTTQSKPPGQTIPGAEVG